MIGCYKAVLRQRTHTVKWTEAEMEPDGVRVVVTKRCDLALNTAGEVRRTYLQRGLLRAVNVHIPSF